MSENKKVAELLIKSNCYVNSEKSGQNVIKTHNGDVVPAYLSCRIAISQADVREQIEVLMTQMIKEGFETYDNLTIIGMATAGITWAHSIAQRLKLPLLYIRSKEKEYGLKGIIEGGVQNATTKAIIVDDVLYTGNTIEKAKSALKDTDIKIEGVACIANLRDKIVNKLEKENIKVMSLTSHNEIIKNALENNILDKNEYEIMKDIYEEKNI